MASLTLSNNYPEFLWFRSGIPTSFSKEKKKNPPPKKKIQEGKANLSAVLK